MNDLTQYGMPGIIIAALAGYVLFIERKHAKERKEWLENSQKISEAAFKSIDNNTAILNSLKTLLETFIILKKNE